LGNGVRLGPAANDVVDEGEGEAAAEVAVGHAHEDEPALHRVVERVRVVHLLGISGRAWARVGRGREWAMRVVGRASES